MRTNTAIGAAIQTITVPVNRRKIHPIRGGMKKNVESENHGTDL